MIRLKLAFGSVWQVIGEQKFLLGMLQESKNYLGQNESIVSSYPPGSRS